MTNSRLDKGESPSGMAPAFLVIGLLLSSLTLWSFAFWHAPEATPEWLTRAQAACFGISETGLPDAAGWLILVLTPLSFLAVAIVTYGGEIVWGLRRLWNLVSGRFFAALLISCVIAEGVWVTGRIKHGLSVAQASYLPEAGSALPESYPRLNEPAPPIALINQRGELVELSALRGRTVLLTFAFAHCQTICPAVVQQARTAVRTFPTDSLYLLIVTLDPWRDTPSALPDLASRWGLLENEHVLSGSVDEVLATLKSYQMEIVRDEQNGDVQHPSLSYVIDSSGAKAYAFSNVPTSWLTESIRRVTPILLTKQS